VKYHQLKKKSLAGL